MTSTRKTALVAGVFYLITFISIPTLPVSALAVRSVPMAVLRRCGAHRTRRTGRIATALVIAHSPATVYSTP
jgi:hypothetical protein